MVAQMVLQKAVERQAACEVRSNKVTLMAAMSFLMEHQAVVESHSGCPSDIFARGWGPRNSIGNVGVNRRQLNSLLKIGNRGPIKGAKFDKALGRFMSRKPGQIVLIWATALIRGKCPKAVVSQAFE